MKKRLSDQSVALLREEVEVYRLAGGTKFSTALEMLLNWYDECVKEDSVNGTDTVSKG